MAYLPHIYPVGATFFITFRLGDSLPQSTLSKLKNRFAYEEKQILDLPTPASRKKEMIDELRKRIFKKYDHQLDTAKYGYCYLKDPSIAKIIWNKIFQYHNQYYLVRAISIMPNHVHLLLDTSIQLSKTDEIDRVPKGYTNVNKFMQYIKGGSAYAINKYLGRTGALWAKESYDHFVRFNNVGEYERIFDYIVQNPVKARLSEKYKCSPYLFAE